MSHVHERRRTRRGIRLVFGAKKPLDKRSQCSFSEGRLITGGARIALNWITVITVTRMAVLLKATRTHKHSTTQSP